MTRENIVSLAAASSPAPLGIRVVGATTLSLTLGIPYAITKGPLPLDAAAWGSADGRGRLVVAAIAFGLAALALAVALLVTALALAPQATRRFPWGLWS